MAKKWIQKAKLKKGAFTSQADKYDMGVQQFANYVIANPEKFSATTEKRARLAKTFKKMGKKRG